MGCRSEKEEDSIGGKSLTGALAVDILFCDFGRLYNALQIVGPSVLPQSLNTGLIDKTTETLYYKQYTSVQNLIIYYIIWN